ncbi:MAG TPA: PQQ-binding-like beta-propeller repeat protein [Caulifigura sp.]|nr:PQQ-binding-like beta-propeller repeat protein [Caulifigura sp.]
MRSLAVFVVLCCSVSTAAEPDAWSQFRGPRNDGIVRGRKLPVRWSADEGVLWKTEIPGLGWSQPIAWGNRIYLTTAVSGREPEKRELDWSPGASGLTLLLSGAGQKVDLPPPDFEYQWKLLCLDSETGAILWEQTPLQGKPKFHIHPSNSYASETPATDGAVIVASFGMAGIYCYTIGGELLWSKDLGVFPTQLGWGAGSSPVLHDGRVFVQCDNDSSSFLVALDSRTGEELWREPRQERSNWATPFLWRNHLRTELVTAGGSRMRSYDPATGKLLWEMAGSGRSAATPVADEELLYVDSYERLTGRTGTLAAIKPGASGDISLKGKSTANDWVAWSLPLSGYRISSPALFAGRLYVFEQNGGIVNCFDAKTGDRVYKQRLPSGRGVVASPLAAESGLYVVNYDGVTTVLEAGAELKAMETNAIDDLCWASLGVVGDRLLLRGSRALYCIGEK